MGHFGASNDTKLNEVNTEHARERDETTHFIYHDKDHYNLLLEKLNTLRKNKKFCDVILQVTKNIVALFIIVR